MSDPLFVLAFDHRASLPSTLGLTGSVDDLRAELERSKEIVFTALHHAASSVSAGRPALLVDEQLGAVVARHVKHAGLTLAMPVERSGEPYFEFEYPLDWPVHIDSFDPDLVKILVRWNPDGDAAANAAQGRRLAELSAWLKDQVRPLMLELLVPATSEQQALDDEHTYDTLLRPELTVAAMQAIRDAGVEPAIWKLEGVDRHEDAVALSATAREGGRDHVRCIILGRGADTAQVDTWLSVAAVVEGFNGFAIGRSIWADPLRAWLTREASESETVQAVADNYLHFVSVYEAALAAA